jgi:hypothetical protein
MLFEVWQYAHLPMFLGIAVAGVGFERTIDPHGGGLWILCAAAATLTAAIAVVGATSGTGGHRVAGQLALSAGMACLAPLAAQLPHLAVVAILLAACGAQTLLGIQPAETAVRRAAA